MESGVKDVLPLLWPGRYLSNRFQLQVREQTLHFPHLPPAFEELRLVQWSDFHAGNFPDTKGLAYALAQVRELKPDLLCFTGDLVDQRSEEFLPYMEMFGGIEARLGIYAVLGNHDYGDQALWPDAAAKEANFERQLALYPALGWKLLRGGESARIEVAPGQSLGLIGAEARKVSLLRYAYGDVAKGLADVAGADLRILLSHQPDHWGEEVLTRFPEIELTLSGHTHGTQIGLAVKGLRLSPLGWLYPRWIDLYQKGGQYLYVNRGVGFSHGSGRLGILPEITLFHLRRG
ncbi:MAG: metallophosphoesterase [Bacteroidetes bacterium]|nr:MAG: metallophosphoesterase [Bacteroidota bacterium]